ncbi:SDR family NAD(P)-dependent oxidoreductase [Aeromicrobium sp. CF3.5]|uniref:SDR family NAD(P)-dependent oxidoreductase n=1 Tax=Aeromicrobium sp. CF3.5 TaxID=3373078 RepID=UPI003EE5961B
MTTPPTTTAVVTGAGRGIGLAFARGLADQGHRVVLTDIDGVAAEQAAVEIGRGAVGISHDVRDPASSRAVAEMAGEHGRLAVWVNNAGVLFAGPAWESTDDELATILDVNVRGVMGGCSAAISQMGTAGGRILNVASISALTPVPGLAMYAATKAAVLSYTTSLQGDLRHAGLPVTVKALCPDVVGTDMVTSREKDPGAAMLFSGPRPLDADEVAAAGLDLLDSRQVFRVVPRWRGALVRTVDVAPSTGLPLLRVMRRLGDARQAKS